MLTTDSGKLLTPVALSGSMTSPPKMLRDVNKRLAAGGWNCVSPINVQDSSNLKNHKFISLEETGFADMYPSHADRPSLNAARTQRCRWLHRNFSGWKWN
jgi:hypothetical protein